MLHLDIEKGEWMGKREKERKNYIKVKEWEVWNPQTLSHSLFPSRVFLSFISHILNINYAKYVDFTSIIYFNKS